MACPIDVPNTDYGSQTVSEATSSSDTSSNIDSVEHPEYQPSTASDSTGVAVAMETIPDDEPWWIGADDNEDDDEPWWRDSLPGASGPLGAPAVSAAPQKLVDYSNSDSQGASGNEVDYEPWWVDYEPWWVDPPPGASGPGDARTVSAAPQKLVDYSNSDSECDYATASVGQGASGNEDDYEPWRTDSPPGASGPGGAPAVSPAPLNLVDYSNSDSECDDATASVCQGASGSGGRGSALASDATTPAVQVGGGGGGRSRCEPPATLAPRADRLWAPSEDWQEVRKGFLWCPASMRLVATRKVSRHLRGVHGTGVCPMGEACPLRYHADLVSFKHRAADLERRCTCGVSVRAEKRGIKAAVKKHLRRTRAHAALSDSERTTLESQIINSQWRTVTRNAARNAGVPVLGRPVRRPAVSAVRPATVNKLALSVEAVGIICDAWLPAKVMSRRPKYVGALRRLLLEAGIEAPDWRYVLGDTANIDAVRRVLANRLVRQPPMGRVMGHALLALVVFTKGRLVTVNDGLAGEWTSELDRFHDMIVVEMKDSRREFAVHQANRMAERQEAPMDVLEELRKRDDLVEAGHRWAKKFLSSPRLDERGAVMFRQVLFVILTLQSGHRTGVWTGLTVAEFRARVRRDDGSDVVHIGGKNLRRMGGTTVVLDARTDALVTFYIKKLRHLLRSARKGDALFPGLQTHDASVAAKALGVPQKHLNAIAKGNSCRRFHASLGFHFQERGNLTQSQMRLLAFYRRHSSAVAERTYEQRNRRELDSGIQRKMLALMRSAKGDAG